MTAEFSTEPEPYDCDAPVLVIKMDGSPLHHGTLGVIRSFGRLGVPVYSCQETVSAPAARSRYLARPSMGVLPWANPDLCVERLKTFQRAVGRPMVVIAMDDKGAMFLAEHADALRPDFLLPPQPIGLPRWAACKANHQELCQQIGVPAPRTFVVQTAADLDALDAGYPAVVKIAQPWMLPPGVRAAALAKGREDVLAYLAQVRQAGQADIIVQEYIPDEVGEDWFVHACCAADGSLLAAFTGRKRRSYPAFLGATSYAVGSVNREVIELARKILGFLSYAGVVELEFRFDRRDGQYKLVDFNPRVGAQFQFLRSRSGVDVVRALHLDLTGRRVGHAQQVEDIAFVSDFTDMAAFPSYWRRGDVGAGEWLLQLLGAGEHAWFAWDDLRPFFAAWRHAASQFLRRRAVGTAAQAISRQRFRLKSTTSNAAARP